MPSFDSNDESRELARKARGEHEEKLRTAQVFGCGVCLASIAAAAFFYYTSSSLALSLLCLTFVAPGIRFWTQSKRELRQYERVNVTAVPAEYRPSPEPSEHIRELGQHQENQFHAIRRPCQWEKPHGRVLARRALGLWFPATVEASSGDRVHVVFDDMDEAVVMVEEVTPVDLQEGDLVFVQTQGRLYLGLPAVLVSMRGESALVHFLRPSNEASTEIAPITEAVLLGDIYIAERPRDQSWTAGDRVLAFSASLGMFKPAIVTRVLDNSLVEVQFSEGDAHLLPATMIQQRELKPGDPIYIGSDVHNDGRTYERWELIATTDETVVARDIRGSIVEVPYDTVGTVPNGYDVVDGRITRIRNVPNLEI